MKKKIDPKEWAEDFKLFMSVPEVSPPQHIRDEVLQFVHRDLNPSVWFVLSKLGGIHIIVGSLSLLICGQFGMGRGYSLMHTFMSYGELTCMALCGALFLGLTTLFAAVIFSNSELIKIRKTGYSPIAILSGVSLAIFFCFGADIALNWALAWFFGAVTTGITITETTLVFRRTVFRHA